MTASTAYVRTVAVVAMRVEEFPFEVITLEARPISFLVRRKPMISKSKLGAIIFIAGIGLASPAFAQVQGHAIGNSPVGFTLVANYGASNLAPRQAGGGSPGYNNNLATDYKLKHQKTHKPPHQQ